MIFFHKKTKAYLFEGFELIDFNYNTLYLIENNQQIVNRSRKIRYLVSDDTFFENIELHYSKFYEYGIEIFFQMNEKEIKLSKKNPRICLNGIYQVVIKLAPGKKFNLNPEKCRIKAYTDNIQLKSGLVTAVNNPIEVSSQGMNLIVRKLYDKERNEIIELIKQRNNIFVVADDFTKFNLKSSFNLIDLSVQDVYLLDDILRENHFELDIKFCLIESTWLGKNNSWRTKVANSLSIEMKYLLNTMKKHKIKIIFFNKEDPYHFETFKHLSYYCDLVLTTSSEAKKQYEQISNAKIQVVRYFIEEKIYNIVNGQTKTTNPKVLFAGSYYPKFVERSNFFSDLFDKLEIDIYDRTIDMPNSINKFPVKFKEAIKGGSLNQAQIIDLLKEYKYVLSLNSIVDSETMVARRVFEMIALGKIQISNYTQAIAELSEFPIIFDEKNDLNTIVRKIETIDYSQKKIFDSSLKVLLENSTTILFTDILKEFEIAQQLKQNIVIEPQSFLEFENFIFQYLADTFNHATNLVVITNSNLQKQIMDSFYYNFVNISFNEPELRELYTIKLEMGMIFQKSFLKKIYILATTLFTKYESFGLKSTVDEELFLDVQEQAIGFQNWHQLTQAGSAAVVLNYKIDCAVQTDERLSVLTNIYPSKENIYRNGFVHTRVLEYQKRQQNTIVITKAVKDQIYIYEEVLVLALTQATMSEYFKLRTKNDKIFIHFMDTYFFDVLKNTTENCRKYIWVHGAEALAGERRRDLFLGDQIDEQVERYIKYSEEQAKMWGQAIRTNQYKFIFVSNWMKQIFDEDMNRENLDYESTIINNPINTNLFKQREISTADFNVLTIRPFASKKYANDITVRAILELSKRDCFSQINFTIMGKGAYFDEILEPLITQNFENVEIIETFLTHEQIYECHKKNHIFLAPTRQDSQGVSMCEAAASGLYVITSNNTAIPEFMSKEYAYLCNEEDSFDMANAIEAAFYNKEKILKKGEIASQKMMAKLDIRQIVDEEFVFCDVKTNKWFIV
ncbi:MAG: glycosyltransferase [Mycoplasmatales bacterium]